jgi:anaerobic selenocysteine-containing dehydrogenase
LIREDRSKEFQTTSWDFDLKEKEGIRKFFEDKWETDRLPRKPGLSLCEIMNAVLEGKIRALYIMGENPALSESDSGHVRKALEKDILVPHTFTRRGSPGEKGFLFLLNTALQ